MKRLSLLTIIVLGAALSCTNEDSINKAGQVSMYKQDVTPEFKSVVKSFIGNSSGRVAGDELIQFDIDNMQAITTDENLTTSFVANQVGYSESNIVNYGLAFFADGNELVAGSIIKTSKNDDGTKQIDYFSLEGMLIVRTIINEGEKAANTEYMAQNTNGRDGTSSSGCGQKTMDCVNEAYTNSGWTSVALTLVSIVEPAVAAGVVAGCGIACLVSNDTMQQLNTSSPSNLVRVSPTASKTLIAVKAL